VPKVTPVKARIYRELAGKLKSITLSRTVTGKYYASLLVDDGLEALTALQAVDSVLCVDMGLAH
jgi:putative transposase